jgi:hypothetical protein
VNKLTIKITLLCISCLLLLSCSSPQLTDYSKTTPILDLQQFFNGKLVAYGMVLNRSGELTRRFNVDLDASWQGNKGIIDEQFVFDDGELSTRVWELTKVGDNSYEGQAGDVVGIAYGETSGSVLHWEYDLVINVDGSDYQVNLDDWMYLLDKNRLFNKTDIIKFGIKVGEIILYIEKVPSLNH